MKLDDILKENYQTVEQKEMVLPQKNKITTPGVELILHAYRKLQECSMVNFECKFNEFKRYKYLCRTIIKRIDFQNIIPDDITQFTLLLPSFKDSSFFPRTGLFLSGLINYHQEKTMYEGIYTLPVDDLARDTENISLLGFCNKSNLHIIGNPGMYACNFMEKGTVTIQGNTDHFLAKEMRGGSIEVFGNTGDILGTDMRNGTITIQGNVNGMTGGNMHGGIITIHGGTEGFLCPSMTGGKVIIHNYSKRDIGHRMSGGTIELFGSYEKISPECEYGTIIHQGKTIFHKEKPWYKKMIGWIR